MGENEGPGKKENNGAENFQCVRDAEGGSTCPVCVSHEGKGKERS